MVARKGSAPSTSRCKPDVILFHHRAEIGCLAWIRTKTNGVKARHAAVTPRGKELVEPEVVATSPFRIKSPVPVCCGFDSVKFVHRRTRHSAFAPAGSRKNLRDATATSLRDNYHRRDHCRRRVHVVIPG